MLEGVKELMAAQFPFLNGDNIDSILHLCAKNNGLHFVPKDKPEYLFGYHRFWPELTDVVEHQNYAVLIDADLTHGPLVYIAAYIAPRDAYSTMWRLIESLNAYGFAFHRYKNERLRFHLIKNSRFTPQRLGLQ